MGERQQILLGRLLHDLQGLPARTTAAARAVRREFSRRLTKAPPRDVIALALRLLDHPGIEFRFVAYELVRHHRAALATLTERDLLRFGRNLDSWGAVDSFACYLAENQARLAARIRREVGAKLATGLKNPRR